MSRLPQLTLQLLLNKDHKAACVQFPRLTAQYLSIVRKRVLGQLGGKQKYTHTLQLSGNVFLDNWGESNIIANRRLKRKTKQVSEPVASVTSAPADKDHAPS